MYGCSNSCRCNLGANNGHRKFKPHWSDREADKTGPRSLDAVIIPAYQPPSPPRIKPGDKEKHLWLSVLAFAIREALSPESTWERRTARAWLADTRNKHVGSAVWICGLFGYELSALERLTDVIDRGTKEQQEELARKLIV